MNKKIADQLDRLDKKAVWHPFTQMKEWVKGPIVVVEKGEGNWLLDTRGRRYIDGVSSLWCNVHGHQVKEIDNAIQKQLRKIAHTTFLGLSNLPSIELAEKLLKIAPRNLKKVFYSDSGSATVEVALKMAFQYAYSKNRKKIKFLKLNNAYHGDTIGSVSVGGIDLFHQLFHPLLFKSFKVEAPYYYRDTFKGSESEYAKFCADKVEKILKKNHKEICAIIVEPLMQGAAGMLKQPKGYLTRVQALAKKYDCLLIVDEVATGFGRTGKMFACEHENIKPDFLCVAKGITGGYLPLSATLTTQKVFDSFLGKFEDFKAFFHGHTYSANPLAAAAACASLDLFKKKKVLQSLQPKITLLAKELKEIGKLDHVGDIRQVGFMVGIELVRDKKTKEAYEVKERVGHRVILEARKHGVMIRPLGNVIILMPPLSITHSELETLCNVVKKSILTITENK